MRTVRRLIFKIGEIAMIVTGYYRNNVVVPEGRIKLPNGTRVSIVIPEFNRKRKPSGLCGIWKDHRSSEKIANEIIAAHSQGREID
jgi:hypothetical protein